MTENGSELWSEPIPMISHINNNKNSHTSIKLIGFTFKKKYFSRNNKFIANVTIINHIYLIIITNVHASFHITDYDDEPDDACAISRESKLLQSGDQEFIFPTVYCLAEN